jgi:hypothetical protein
MMQRILSLGNERPEAIGFTIDDILKWPVFRLRNAKRNSIRIALYRFIKLGIVMSPRSDSSGRRLFKVKNSVWARAYIEGNHTKPWIPLTPTPSSDQFHDFDEHRDHFDVQLTKEWFERINGRCEVNNNQYTLRNKAFTLSLNGKSYAGQIFIRPYWRTEVKHQIGEDFYRYLADKELRGSLQGDFCLPVSVIGQRFYIGGRPTQFSASHYPAQLDIRHSKNDSHIVDGLFALTNQADFNTRTFDFQDAVLEVLKKQGEVQSKTAEAIQKLVQLFSPQSEQSYQAPSEDRGDFAYR